MEQSFAALQEYFSPSRQHENTSNPAQLVLFAEHALKTGHPDVASKCIQLYFSLDPPANQFLIRAHLCEALVAAPSSSSAEESWLKLQEALGCIVTAVNIARKSECYHFLVYNASVQLWCMCRPFQRPGHCRVFAKALQTVVKALEECKEKDHAWRLELMMGLVRSQLDAGQREEAARMCAAAAQLARRRAPNKMVDILKLQVYHHLGDGKVFEKETKSSPELAAVTRLYRVKCAIQQQSSRGPDLEQKLRKVFTFITKGEEGSSGRRTGSVTSVSPPAAEVRPGLLIDLAGVCVEQHFTELALECMDAVPGREEVEDPRLGLQKEFIHCQLMVQQLGPAEEESYARSSVEVRLQAVGRMEEALTSALRLGDPELIQHASVVQWNLCLPLLHPNLRHHLSKPLTAVASALEHVSSLLRPLRCAAHLELAKVCADRNQLQAAVEHLSKALLLDPHGECSGRVRALQHRLLLRAQLYDTPEDPVDSAAKIVEQAGSTADKSTSPQDLRSVLVNAGELLAPDCFTHTLGNPRESASNDGALSHEHLKLLNLQEKGKKLRDLELVKQQVQEHTKAVEQSRDRERCRLWADLAKTARKQEIWDVASAAARFCLLYDDGRWTVQQKSGSKSETKLPERTSSPRINRHASSLTRVESHRLSSTRSGSPFSPFATGMEKPASHSEEDDRRELLRTLAETHCLLAECLVYQLQQEGVGLGEQPAPPTITQQEHDHWRMYCDWTSQLSADARSSFLRAAELGCSLAEAWLVCNAATYLWNYSHQWIEQDRPSELVGTFRPLLASIKQARLQNEALLVCRVSMVVAKGLVQRWMPRPKEPITSAGEGGGGGGGGKKSGKQESRGGAATAKKGKGGGGGEQLQVDPEAGPELKEALEVCEYGMGVSAGVPVAVRGGLLAVWVQCKQLLQQPIPAKTFGVEEQTADPHTHHCRAIVAIEMISRMGNGIWDFPNCPSLQEAFSLLGECVWDGGIVGMELYIRIASLALKQKDYEVVCQCAEKVLQEQEGKSHDGGKQKMATGKPDLSQRVQSELLCLASSLLGQSLVASAAGNMATTRRALEAFLDSARYAHRGRSYPRVMEACRHYWNTCLPLAGGALDRELLQHPLSELLGLVTSLMGGRGRKRKSEGRPQVTSDPTAATSTTEEDMRLLVAMYGLVFQAYADQQQWKEGLKAIEDAMWATPRAAHRHLAQHKLVFKSRMGRSVEGDMIRFQEEPEEFIATQWYKAAANASNPAEQLRAYQNAIQTLQSPSHSWQKVEYLLEFSEWLYCHEFPVQDALDQLQVAADILSTKGDENLADPPSPPLDPPSPPTPPTSVRHLEALVRVYVMMAELCGRGSAQHQALCLTALGYCNCIWKQTLDLYGEAKSGSGGCPLPMEVVGWATFALTDEVKDFIRTGSEMGQLSRTTVQKPMLLVHYLGILARELCARDLLPLALPAFSLQLATAECLVTEGSNPLCRLIHMRIASVCTSLGLHSAAATHSDGGTDALNPEDLAQSHAEMEHCVTKRQAMEREEAKHSTDHAMARSQAKGSPGQPDQLSTAGLYRLSDRVQLREVWVQQASLLIQQGQHQASRELLHEARLSSQTLGDVHTLVGALLGLATLALAEGNTQKAANLLAEAQHLPSHWDSWLAGVLLLSEITCREEEGEREGSCHGQTRAVVEWALHLLEAVGERSKSEVPKVQRAESLLKSRLAVHTIQQLFGSEPAPQATSQVVKKCDVLLQCSQTLLQLGHHREAAQVMAQQASILRRVGLATENHELHQENILQALSLYQKAAEILQCTYENGKSLCQPSEEISLPVQRELVSTQLCIVDLLVLVFEEHIHEQREARNMLQQKSSIEKMIDEFVRETPVLSPTGQEWKCTASSAMERALGILSSAHSLASNDSVLKAKCAYSIGRCLHLLSKCTSPDPELQWRVKEGEDGKGEEGRLGGGVHRSTLSTVMRTEEASQAEVEESSSLGYLAQAIHSMVQAVTLALQDQEWDLAMKAALEIVDCCGRFDPTTTSQYLALYQSCAVAQELCSLLREAQSDPSSSQLAALLQQYYTLKQSADNVSVPALSAIKERMETFESWRRLRVVENHLDLLKHFPCHFRFVVLQHSPDRSQLYAAYLVPPQPPPPAPKKGQPPPQIESLDPVVVCASTSPEALNSLLELSADFQHNVALTLAKSSHLDKQHKGEQCGSMSPDGLDSQFADIQAAMEAYLSTATNPIAGALRRESSDKELTVVLLADSSLLQLPLEALSFLHAGNIHSVARDFSLQMFYHRIAKYAPENSAQPDSSKDKKRGSYQPQPPTLLADAGNIKYVLDPRDDMIYDGGEDPCGKIVGQIQVHAKLTSKWGKHVGTDNPISDGEWPPLLQSCSGLLFFGSERFLAHLPPARLTSLSLQDCSVVILMDRMQTSRSALIQSKLDLHKSAMELRLENHLQTVMLLSLVGANCVVGNQCHTAVHVNLDKMNAMIKGLLSESNTVGSLNWTYAKCALNKAQVGDGDGDAHETDVQGSTGENRDTSLREAASSDRWSLYNCVLYGLPHLTLVAQTTA